MQTNHSGERKRKSFLWIIVVVPVLLVGAFVVYSWYMGTRSTRVSAPVVARGKIPPPPPAPSMESPAGPSAPIETAPPAGADSAENAPASPRHGEMESFPATALDAGPQESAPETAFEIAAPSQEDSAIPDTERKPGGDAEQTGLSDSSDGTAATPASDDKQPADASGDELQATANETPDSSPPSDTITPQSSDQPVKEAEPAPTELSPGVPAAAPFTVQVGAYRGQDNADRQVALLREKGYDAYLHEKNEKDQRAWYFVRFGRFKNFGSADKALKAFKAQEQMDGTVVKAN